MELTYQIVLENLKNDIPFSYARYGDGEWNAILGKDGQNCDKHKYFPEMGKRLKRIIDNVPKYHIGMQSLARNQNTGKPEFDELVKKNQWCSTELFTRASIKGNIQPFFDALKGKNIIFVTNKYTSDKLNEFYHTPVYIPEVDCWNNYDIILREIKKHIVKYSLTSSIVILYSASMMANVLIADIYGTYGNMITNIDTGSVFDPYVGRNTRSYHKNLKI